jgi:hypothetical protein
MITFIDGPAQGVQLNLRRAPIMLRVVQSARAWDALDQPDDDPRRGEQVHVYIQVGPTQTYHMKCAKRSASGWYTNASYRHFPDQPAAEHVSSAAAWAIWCDTNRLALLDIKKAMEAVL